MTEGRDLAAAIDAATRWALFDPDHVTRGQLDALVDARDPSLIELFTGRIAFGTAGLRATVGPGPNLMNALVVRQATAGVVRWLQTQQGVAEPRVLIGFDARYDSPAFAEQTAMAVLALGGTPLLADRPGPTPVFAHAVLGERADAGIVITASHNPAADNGYKLYLGDGMQIVPPADEQIAAAIDELAADWTSTALSIDDIEPEQLTPYRYNTGAWVTAHASRALDAQFTTDRSVLAVYTAMHGVGGEPFVQAWQRAGFEDLVVVDAQFEPDPAFPTVPFPNPEEPGALDLAIEAAVYNKADVVIAHDPDADRLALAVPTRDGDGFTPLSGNELGALLADHVLRHTSGDRVVARSIVSSRLLDAMAASLGIECVVALTGFKWVARPIVTHLPAQYVFGFEEAIGYCIGTHVRDKDGITAGLVAGELIAELVASGRTVWDRLDELAVTHGLHLNQPVTIRFDQDPSGVADLMAAVAASPPNSLGGSPVTESGPVGLGTLPPTSGLHLVTGDNTQVIIRPSGTEPKIKAYVEVIEPVGDLDSSRQTAQARLDATVADVQALLSR